MTDNEPQRLAPAAPPLPVTPPPAATDGGVQRVQRIPEDDDVTDIATLEVAHVERVSLAT